MSQKAWVAALGVALSVVLTQPAAAKTLRWANDGDVPSMDPYFQNETTLIGYLGNVYDPLVGRGKKLELEPRLALSWENTAPTVWRFHLRPNVKFADGTPFSPDDVIFSYQRVTSEGSDFKGYLATVKEARKVDDLTVDFITTLPNPLLPAEITTWFIMSKNWCEKNDAVRVASATKREETYATYHTNGTGAFMVTSREPDVRTVAVPNPNWWDKPEHNLTEVDFSVIKSDATRVAALLSGEIDMIYTVPIQDVERVNGAVHRKVLQGPELRTIFLGMDQWRDELIDSDVKGKNPFKDVRVRRAFYQAIDEDTIAKKVMRGAATPSGIMVAPAVNGWDKSLNGRYPYDPKEAKRLLTEAGYGDGFTVGMNCPNDRYVNDEQICQAVAAMLARIGVKINLVAETKSKYFAKILARDTSFYLLGWTPGSLDAHNSMFNLMASPDVAGRGKFNLGRFSDPRFDELTTMVMTELDPEKRNAEISEAFKLHKEAFGHIPLHQQALAWGIKDNVHLIQLPTNIFVWRWVHID
jgi:peptide/nickel transport system substrate-binding protein